MTIIDTIKFYDNITSIPTDILTVKIEKADLLQLNIETDTSSTFKIGVYGQTTNENSYASIQVENTNTNDKIDFIESTGTYEINISNFSKIQVRVDEINSAGLTCTGQLISLNRYNYDNTNNLQNEIETEIDNLLDKHIIKTPQITLSEELNTGNWTLGNGWSGDNSIGFTHASGTKDGTITLTTSNLGTYFYLVELTVDSTNNSKNGCSGFTISVGGSEPFEMYEGNFTNHTYIRGIQAKDDSNVVITATATDFVGTISNISIKTILSVENTNHQMVDEDGNVVFALVGNYESENLCIGRNNARKDVGGARYVAIGVNALQNNTTGFWNVAIGYNAMQENTVGSRNVAIGYIAMRKVTSGHRNVSIGSFCMHDITSGFGNIAIGADTMQRVVSGSNNIGMGTNALANITTQTDNVGIGYDSLGGLKRGLGRNVAIGSGTSTGELGYNNTIIGYKAKITDSHWNSIAIGNAAQATKSNQCVIGNSDVSEFIFGGKKIIFNEDGTVTWEALA